MSGWKRSTYCNIGGCVEVQVVPDWRESSFCLEGGCVSVAHHAGEILVRDSKQPDQAPLRFDADEWRAFVLGVRAGEFDVDGAA